MSRALKRFKDYERWVLIGLVIILLATFSVTGVVGGCERQGALVEDLGGTYEPVPGRVENVTDQEFRIVRDRYGRIYSQEAWGPSIRFAPDLAATERRGADLDQATWNHLAAVGAAKAAGYAVGDQELVEGIEELVIRALPRRMGTDPRTQGVRFTPELYDEVVRGAYRGSKLDFEQTVREILLKDKYLGGLVDAQRFTGDREAAYDEWKTSRERVDLQYAALEAAPFRDAVRLGEETRSRIAEKTQAAARLVEAAEGARRVQDAAKAWKDAHEGKWPADAAALVGEEPGKRHLRGAMPKDPWGTEYVYALAGDGIRVTSAGPDATLGTPDDVGAETLDLLSTLPALRRLGEGILAWRKATGSWPPSLEALLGAPPTPAGSPALPAPLAAIEKDAWGRDFLWESAGPSLLSVGPDGARGTPDDLPALLEEARVRVPVPAVLTERFGGTARDAWGHDLRVELRSANPLVLGATSPGPDGAAGTPDDVVDGNAASLRDYYQRVRGEFRHPLRREFDALYVLPALVPDETFAAAWTRFPEFQPKDKEAWDLFRSSGLYTAEEGEGASAVPLDAGDPKKGFSAALLEDLRSKGRLGAEAKAWQVPAASAFGARKDPEPSSPGGLPTVEADPLYKSYVEKGWRYVVLRDLFFEKLLNAALTAARTSTADRKAWEAKGKTGPEPAAVTFTSKLGEWADLQPGEADSAAGARFVQYFSTAAGEPLSREELEKLADLGDTSLSMALGSLQDDDYAVIPTLLRDGALRAILHSVKRHDARDAELDEVRERVWPGYLEARAMDRAVAELTALRASLEKAAAAAGSEVAPEVKVTMFEAAAKEFVVAGLVPPLSPILERTGLFVGSVMNRAPTLPEDAPAAERAAALRRAYVRRFGYDDVRATRGAERSAPITVGQLGREVLRDDATGENSTGCAYLVQVAAHAFPSREEFHAAEYLEIVARGAYDLPEWYPSQVRRGQPTEGRMVKLLEDLYEDGGTLSKAFSVQRHRPPAKPREVGRPARP